MKETPKTDFQIVTFGLHGTSAVKDAEHQGAGNQHQDPFVGDADDGNSELMRVVPVVALVAADAYEEFQLFAMTAATGQRMLTYGFDDEQEDVKVTAQEVEVHLGVGRNVEETLGDSNDPLSAVLSVGNVVVWIETEDLQQEQKQRRFLSQLGFGAVS